MLEQALAKSLRVERDSLTTELVAEKLEYFELNNAGLRDLTGLESAKNLKVLVLRDNLIQDISPLSDLPHLQKLIKGCFQKAMAEVPPTDGESGFDEPVWPGPCLNIVRHLFRTLAGAKFEA